MPINKWIEKEPRYQLRFQPTQQAFLQARRKRLCPNGHEYFVTVFPEPQILCPTCRQRGTRAFDRLTLIAGRRFGKAERITNLIPTPTGWRQMIDIRAGDQVFDENGKPILVTYATEPWYETDCLKVTFSDGNSIVVAGDHEWMVHDKAYRKSVGRRKAPHQHWTQPTTGPRVVTTTQMLREGLAYQGKESRFAIPNCHSLQYATKDLLIDPYVLGVWLGDGNSNGPGLTSNDVEIVLECANRGYPATKHKAKYHYGLGVRPNGLGAQLRSLDLINNKHIPRSYLEANIAQRLDLLKGLMDTDGYCSEKGYCEFTTTKEALADQVYELLVGLGEKTTIFRGLAKLNGRVTGPKFRLHFTPSQDVFHLPRKLARQRKSTRHWIDYRYIVAIDPAEPCFVKCIQVDSPTSLYLTSKACIPTHNSRVAAIAGVEEACLPKSIGWACAPTNEKLHRYVIPAFQELIPKSAVVDWSIEHKDLRLKNGALIHFQTLEDPDQGRGQGLDWLYIDEVAELSQMHWDVIRPSLAGDTVAFFTTTPRGFDWVYKELYSKAVQGAPGYWAMQAKSIDSANPDLSAGFLDRERETMGSQIFQQEYEADFVTFTGSIYGDAFRDDFHTIRSLDKLKQFIPSWPDISGLPQLVGLDAGADHPFAAIRLAITERGLIGIGEYLQRNQSFYQHAQNIRTMCGGHDTRYAINRNDRQGIIELAQHGIMARPANNDVVAGIERVKSWLLHEQMFFVEWLCPQTLRQIKSYRWSEANTSERDGSMRRERVHKVDDDLMDALRYATLSFPILPRPKPDSRLRDLSKLDEKTRQDILTMRRIDKAAQENAESKEGENWGDFNGGSLGEGSY